MSQDSAAKDRQAEAVEFDPFAGPRIALSVPATEPQKEIWISARLGPDASCAFNESVTLELEGRLDAAAFARAFELLQARHESLRATFSPDGELMCIAEGPLCALQSEDLSGLDQADRSRALPELLDDEVRTPFDLERGPLCRGTLVRLGASSHRFVFTAHHIVCDGWSIALLLRDLGQLYGASLEGRADGLPAAGRFGDYAVAQAQLAASPKGREIEEYWLQSLSDPPPSLDLPADFPRPPLRSFESRRLDVEIDADLVKALKSTGAKHGASFFATLFSAFSLLCARSAGQNDVVIGIPSAGQLAAKMNDLVGHCVNLLPVRARIREDQPFGEFLKSVRACVLDAYDRQQYTYGSVLRKLKLARDPSRLPLVSVQFNLEQAVDGSSLSYPGLQTGFRSNPRLYENFEIFLNAVERRGRLLLEVQYNTQLFSAESVARRMAGFEALLRAIVADPAAQLGLLPLCGEAERKLLIDEWNRTSRSWSFQQGLPALLADSFSRQTAKTAAIDAASGETCSYSELWSRSAEISRYLISRGAGPGSVVGVCMERGIGMLAAVLGVLRSGAAYLPLDPGYPAERLRYMVSDSGLKLALTDAKGAASLEDAGAEIVELPAQRQSIAAARGNADCTAIGPDDLAYVIYTSGSTGRPKGVQVRHGSVVNFLRSMAEEPGLGPDDVLLAVTTLSFDIAVLELYLPLSTGATVLIAGRSQAGDGRELAELIDRHAVSCLQATPATWRLLLDSGWRGRPGMKALCGGEAMPRELVAPLLERVGALWNMYGPTETTVWSSCERIPSPGARVSIGRPIANTRIYILDPRMQPAPAGAAGEIYIGGAGVARGYLGRPELTAERFLADPFASGERIYRTGDLGRFLPDGRVEHLGRADDQIKLRGYRIELGEIEALLCQAEGVSQAVVALKGHRADDQRLVAFIVPELSAEPNQIEIRKLLRRNLPEHMLPSHIMEIASLPLTNNGKIDRRALPGLEEVLGERDLSAYAPPASETEKSVAADWSELLGVEKPGLHDNFFNLGGHSLLALQAVTRADRRYGIKLSPRAIILETLQNVAREIDQLASANAAGSGEARI